MELARRLWRERVAPAWVALANAVGGFLDEAAFRAELAFDVLAGRVPMQKERRRWNRSAEVPILIDTYDWTDERLLFSVLVWPPLESPKGRATSDHQARVREVKEAIARGCVEMAWSTRFDTDHGLRWDPERACWTDRAGHAYDGTRFYAYSRGGS